MTTASARMAGQSGRVDQPQIAVTKHWVLGDGDEVPTELRDAMLTGRVLHKANDEAHLHIWTLESAD